MSMKKIVCLLLCLTMVLSMAACGKKEQNGGTATYTIRVQSAAEIPLKDVGIFIYEDSTQKELVAYLTTDAEGQASFTDVQRSTYVAVLDKIPTGYEAEESYAITGEMMTITLKTGKMSDADMEALRYKLGDAMMDFTVTGPDGTQYTLSGLFEGKKAVVLNFFYNGCQPCMNEFPYLQEAYEAYSDDIAVLAMNPVDGDDASVETLRKQLGVTFPMVKCDPMWEKVMELSAYPTTVFIDRFGNICLIHKGSVTEAKVFEDAFAYFAAEDYTQKMVEAIGDLATEEPEGTKENPTEIGGVTSFEVTVEPGQVVYTDLYKTFNMYLRIKSENAYVICNGKTYKPEKGVVSLKVNCPDTYTPVNVGIGNSGTKTETFKVTLSVPAGTLNNPHKLVPGEFDVKVAAGNDQGVYYTYKAAESGTLTLQYLSGTKGVEYGYFLYNLTTGAMRNLESDSVTDENGVVTVSVDAKKGHTVQVCISTLPDKNNSYPAGEFRFLAIFDNHEIKEEEKVPTTDYTVTVVDDENRPLSNVSVVLKVEDQDAPFATNGEGVAKITLPTGTYQGIFYVPDGYTAETTAFTLTGEVPNVKLTVNTIRQKNYTVKVVGPTAQPVANVFVKIGDNAWQRTDANGAVTLLLDVAEYSVTIMVPQGYSGETAYQFPENTAELTITLGYPAGSEQNPVEVNAYPFVTDKLSGAQEVYCKFNRVADVLGIVIADPDAYIRYGSTTVGADVSGNVKVSFEEIGAEAPWVLVIGNSGTAQERYTVEAVYEKGSVGNPEPLTTLGNMGLIKYPAGDTNGYCYSYTTPKNGVFSVQVKNKPAVSYDVVLSADDEEAKMSESQTEREVTLPLEAGQTVKIHIFANPDENDTYPELSVRLWTSFKESAVEPEPTEPEVPETTEGATTETTESVTTETTEETTTETTQPAESEPDTGDYVYKVKVTDHFGGAVAGVDVLFLYGGAPAGVGTTDAQGVAQLYTDVLGTYTVELAFTGTQYYYDTAAAVLTQSSRELTIKLTALLDESQFEEIYILNGNPAYRLKTGGTRVQLGNGKPNFSAEYENNCFFVFTPKEAGTYQITASGDVELSMWGTTTFISRWYGSKDEGRENALTESVSGSTVGNVTYVIGIKVDGSVRDVVVSVARIGDPQFSIADQPWSEWKSGLTHTDKWITEAGLTPVMAGGEIGSYALSKAITYLDFAAADGTYNLYYDETNGYYRLYENGPVILVDLNAKGRFVPLYERINGNGQYGGSAVTKYFYDEAGTFLRKENYTEYLQGCFDYVYLNTVDEKGYYPLTKDMMHVLQNGFVQWWDAESPNYMEGFADANPNYAWMFACGYVEP